jgi:hypothetical protein
MNVKNSSKFLPYALGSGLVFLTLSGCTPRVEVAAPSEPITINLNVKIDHEVRVKVEKDLDKVISKDSGLF